MSQEMNHKRSMIVHYQGDCNWQGNFPRDKVPDPRSASLSTCLGRCKTMIDEIKKIIDINEKLVRMGCSPGYINGNNGNPGIWKTILVSGWEQKAVKECLQSACLKNGKYRQMHYGHEELYDIEDAVNMMTRDDKKYLKKYEDHIGYHENIKQTCIQLKNEIEAECKQKGLNQPHIHIYGLQTINKPPIKTAKVAAAVATDTGCAKKKATPKKKVVEAEVVEEIVKEEVPKDVKTAAKASHKRKRKTGNRPPSGIVKPTLISDELAAFLGKDKGTQIARTEVTREINAYIRANQLQDETNGRRINADAKLSSLFKLKSGEELTYFNLQRYISPHFAKSNIIAEEDELADSDEPTDETEHDEPEELFVGKKSYVL